MKLNQLWSIGLRHSLTIGLTVFCSLIVSCSKESDAQSDDDIKSLVFSVQDYSIVNDGEGSTQTKTSITNEGGFLWSDGDTLGIYPSSGSQVFFAMTDGADAKYAKFDGGGWNFKASHTYYAYYPFIGNIYLNKEKIPVSFVGQKQTNTTGTGSFGAFDYMYAPGTSSEAGVLNFEFKHLCCVFKAHVTNLPEGTYTKMAITAPGNYFVKEGHYSLLEAEPSIVGSTFTNQLLVNLEGITLAKDSEFDIYLLSAPVNLAGKEITISVLDSQKKELQCKKSAKDFKNGVIYKLNCYVWTEVPQNMGMIIEDWGNGGSITGEAE